MHVGVCSDLPPPWRCPYILIPGLRLEEMSRVYLLETNAHLAVQDSGKGDPSGFSGLVFLGRFFT